MEAEAWIHGRRDGEGWVEVERHERLDKIEG